MTETIKAGWLTNYDGNKFAPKTFINELLNSNGASVFNGLDELGNLGSLTTPIYISGGQFQLCSLPTATNTTPGMVKVGAVGDESFDPTATDLMRAVDISEDGILYINLDAAGINEYGLSKVYGHITTAKTLTTSTTADRDYGVCSDKDGKLYVNVPWKDHYFTPQYAVGVKIASKAGNGTSDLYVPTFSSSQAGLVPLPGTNQNNSNYCLNGSGTWTQIIPTSGGTITGDLQINGTLTINNDLKFTNGSGDDLSVLTFDTNNNNDGYVLLVHSCGYVGVGSGESAMNVYDEQKNNSSSSLANVEDLHLSSDRAIYLYTNCNTVSNKKTITLTTGGVVVANGFNAASDLRLKENFRYFTHGNILDLPIYKFDYINGSKNRIGCIAQDLQKICPEIVHENDDGYLSIEESKIVYLLLNKMKEMQKEIDELKGV